MTRHNAWRFQRFGHPSLQEIVTHERITTDANVDLMTPALFEVHVSDLVTPNL